MLGKFTWCVVANLSLKHDLGERNSFLDPHSGRPSPGKVKAGLARAAIVDVARDSVGRFYVLDAWADRVSTREIIDNIIVHHHRWHPTRFGVDSTAQQNLFVDTVRDILRLQGQSLVKIVGIARSSRVDKVQYIRTVLGPVVSEHRLLIASNLIELRAELLAFPTGATVDIVDALAGAISLFPPTVSKADEREYGDGQYRQFLRDCGMNDDEIDARLAEEGENDIDSQYQRDYNVL